MAATCDPGAVPLCQLGYTSPLRPLRRVRKRCVNVTGVNGLIGHLRLHSRRRRHHLGTLGMGAMDRLPLKAPATSLL